MSQEEQGRAALALLWQAGRLDLLKEEALAPGVPGLRQRRSGGYGVFASARWSRVFPEEDPGELGAARSPREEGKVRPGAVGRITSAGW
ncbi:hypothetical protein NDU88_000227 [Pleurodeles waltl]|uniref:Uncharacterized protein n=1 Tax=Pleurodeles waltl TaxID=8319 RepID=A0AAV7TF47_PLEWA|nr:hypothetical protein NDU88_000227 [Pleurodeles waltl]